MRALVVISAGFAESGEEGRHRQADLLEVCRRSGMRLIGPNCMGILNTDPEHALNATFGPTVPPAGRVGFLSQSGALGLAVIEGARRLGLGISSFVSVGNKADISGNDLLEYWEADDATDLVLLYLESFGNPRRFSQLARRVSRTKPIVAVKAGRSLAGVRATSSHTGALLATSDVTVDALFRQSGVIRVDDLGELYDVASLLAAQPPPAGRRVGILTNAGGLGILCADACAADGLEVPELPDAVRRRLGEFLPPEASLANPVDMIASASREDYERAIEVLGASSELDALIVIFIPPLLASSEGVQESIERAAASVSDRPVLAVLPSAADAAPRGRVPAYGLPENAARALARSAAWAEWRQAPDAPAPELDARRDEARAVVAAPLARARGEGGVPPEQTWLAPDEVARVLDCYGIPMAEWRLAPDAEEAAKAAAELGGPVALKAVAHTLVHKTDVGGVLLGLEGAEAVRDAARSVEAAVREGGHRLDGYLVQRMAEPGVEMLVGVVQDPVFGEVVACGAGGAAAELLHDVRVGLAPLAEGEARTMVRSLATFPLLDGYRGAPRADMSSLEAVLLRIGALANDLPEIAELDLNPVAAGPGGACVLDARMRVEAPYRGRGG